MSTSVSEFFSNCNFSQRWVSSQGAKTLTFVDNASSISRTKFSCKIDLSAGRAGRVVVVYECPANILDRIRAAIALFFNTIKSLPGKLRGDASGQDTTTEENDRLQFCFQRGTATETKLDMWIQFSQQEINRLEALCCPRQPQQEGGALGWLLESHKREIEGGLKRIAGGGNFSRMGLCRPD